MNAEVKDQAVTKDAIIEVLKTIEDPEIFLDIWFLGLIYSIEIDQDSNVDIEMTFTTPLCPAGPQLRQEVIDKVGAIPGVSCVEVDITFDPPWQPSDEVKGMMGMM